MDLLAEPIPWVCWTQKLTSWEKRSYTMRGGIGASKQKSGGEKRESVRGDCNCL